MAISSRIDTTKMIVDSANGLMTSDDVYLNGKFSTTYIDAVFTIWYSAGKPNVRRLVKMLPDPSEFGLSVGYPSEPTLKIWHDKFFSEKAVVLDEQVSKQLAGRLIAEKVAMLDAHAAVAAEMQRMALDYLRDNKDKLSPNAAVRMLVEGVRIERESKGIPRTLEKLADKSDEDLLSQIEDLLLRSPVDLQPIKDDED